mgnify:CR=1 FL=1
MREGNEMKVKITEEIARRLIGVGGPGHLAVFADVEYYVSDGEDYTLSGDYSTFRAVPLIEIDVEDEDEIHRLDLYNIGVTIAHPMTEAYAEAVEKVENGEEERSILDWFDDWHSQYDENKFEIWDIGDRLPQNLDEIRRSTQ